MESLLEQQSYAVDNRIEIETLHIPQLVKQKQSIINEMIAMEENPLVSKYVSLIMDLRTVENDMKTLCDLAYCWHDTERRLTCKITDEDYY